MSYRSFCFALESAADKAVCFPRFCEGACRNSHLHYMHDGRDLERSLCVSKRSASRIAQGSRASTCCNRSHCLRRGRWIQRRQRGRGASTSEAQTRYRHGRPICMSDPSRHDRTACLRKVGAALHGFKREHFDDGPSPYEQSRRLRCVVHPAGDREDCAEWAARGPQAEAQRPGLLPRA